MARHSTPSVAIILCPIPDGITAREATTWLSPSAAGDVPVTWTTTLEKLPMVRDAAHASLQATAPTLALDLSTPWPTTRQALRHTLRSARALWPGLDAAVFRGPISLDHRDVLVQEGITTAVVDRFDPQPRGSRRPAPRGWPCRSVAWGLWEVSIGQAARAPLLASLVRWRGGSRKGGLTVLHAAPSGDDPSVPTIRSRLERQRAWIRRRSHGGSVRPIRLSDLPSIIAGAEDATLRGSVLRAA